ncbi:MAG: NarK/NasA family nitrate transporter [Tabrizicola sp.]|nr:NarK/NasA family nitrate transporter [Tabrizicola sp.]
MLLEAKVTRSDQTRALALSTIAFTACFAVWTIFAIIGVAIKKELSLNEFQFGLLVATPILTGSIVRIVLGVWTERYGGRIVFPLQMLAAAASTWALTFASTYPAYLLAALGIGLSGGSFIIGVAYVSRWYDKGHQGTALGIFGAGNVGAAVTKFIAPFVMVAYGWQGVAQVWAAGLALMAVIFFALAKDDPELTARRAGGYKPPSWAEQFAPLKKLQVWRFSLYYFFVFGAFVALALWLPRYLTGAYGLDVKTAGMIAACYSIPASLFRVVGGWMSDRIGARRVMYWTFGVSAICTFLLSYPSTTYVVDGITGPIEFRLAMGVVPFTVLVFVLGFFMSLGKAAVYKHIPVYYPDNVGAVGGVVGMIGGLGGFILPIAFGAMNDLTGVWTSCVMLMFVIVAVSLVWMHLSIVYMERRKVPELAGPKYFPEGDILGPVLPAPPGEGTTPTPAAAATGKPHITPVSSGARA